MSLFKDLLQQDIDNVFMNPDELGEPHMIGDKQFAVVVDYELLKQRTKKEYDGMYVGDILFFVSAKKYGTAPKIDSMLTFDGKTYMVFDARTQGGVHEIILQRNGS